MHLNPVLEELGTYPIAAIHERARRMRDAGERLIDFSIGDPREPTPPFIPEALKAAVPDVSQYPTAAGLPTLREAVAGYLERRFGVLVDPDTEVLPTAGSKEGIFTTPLAFIESGAGDVVVYGTPGYPVYERGARFAGAETHPVRLDGDFVMRAADIADEVWARARLVWVCSPHNPAGSITSTGDLGALLRRARATGAILAVDECYADLYDDTPPPSILQVAAGDYRGILAYFSCSKRSGMTGYRSGAIVGDAAAIAALRGMRSSIGVASPEFVQAAAAAAWSDDVHAAERRKLFTAKRDTLRRAFDAIGFEVVASGAGLYVWVRVPDELVATTSLLEQGVVVSPGSAFGAGGEGYLRLALVPTLEECEAAVEVVQACLTGN